MNTNNNDLTVKQLIENGFDPSTNHAAMNALALHYLVKCHTDNDILSQIANFGLNTYTSEELDNFYTLSRAIGEAVPEFLLGSTSFNDLCEYEELYTLLDVELIRLYSVYDVLYIDYKSAAYVSDIYGKVGTEIETKKVTLKELNNLMVYTVINDIQVPVNVSQGVRMETGENVF